jgi:hypothetical protein
MLRGMRHTGLLFGVCLVGCLGIAACKDNDEPPSEPMRHMDSGLHMPERDAATDAQPDAPEDTDGGDADGGDTDGGQ